MEDHFGRIEIPVHEVVELKGGKEKITEKKSFRKSTKIKTTGN